MATGFAEAGLEVMKAQVKVAIVQQPGPGRRGTGELVEESPLKGKALILTGVLKNDAPSEKATSAAKGN
jgi:hypothetical protein